MNKYVIDIQNISKSFKTKQVLKGLSLAVSEGAVFGLLGKNGAGKTTLIKCVLGLIKTSSGTISVLEDDPWNFKEETKEKLGFVPQSDRPYPWLSVGQMIEYTASFYDKWNPQIVDKLVSEWELDINDKVGLLSEGQAQKLSIILSLGHEPELLIFDEPVASLDPRARRQFLKTILDIVSNRLCTVFFSTHITSDLERVADSVAVLKEGKIDFCGGLDDLKDEVKMLRMTSKDSFAENISFDGLIHCESSMLEAVMSVRGYNDQMKRNLEEKFNAQIEVQDLNLEEIFLELNR